ncbi:MAG: sensor domain-containing diguanylate cyclase [Spirochaetaceae bacterium]
MYRSIRVRASILICTIIGSSFLFLGIYNYNISKTSIHNQIVNSSIPLLRENIYSEIEKSFVPALGVSAVMAQDSFLINWVINNENELGQITQYLNKLKNEFGYTTAFFISERTGKYYYYNGILKVLDRKNDHDKWYYTFIESGLDYDLDVDFDEADNNRLTIFINNRVKDFDGKLLGVAGIGITMENFSEFLSKQQEDYNRTIYLVDQNGVVQAHSDIKFVENENINSKEGIKSISKKLIDNTEPTIENYKLNGQSILVSSKYIDDVNWYLIVEQNETVALKGAFNTLIRTLIVGILLLTVILLVILQVLNYFSKKLEVLAATDPLTSCYNRREFDTQLNKVLIMKKRNAAPVSIIMIDIDNFKMINDANGHQFGDFVLTELTSLIKQIKRPNDILCRLGGDEFAILLESNLYETKMLANRIRTDLSNKIIQTKKNKEYRVTLSMGVYEAGVDDTMEVVINNSDKALYRAKESGRDCIK